MRILQVENLPILTFAIVEKINATIGALVIRKNKITWDETGCTVLCYQCMQKTNEDKIGIKDERPFMSFTGPENL